MYDADRYPRAPGIDGNASRRGLLGAARAVPVSALGYVGVRAAVHSDPELRHQEAAIQAFCARRGWRLVAVTVGRRVTTRQGALPTLAHPCVDRLQRERRCEVASVERPDRARLQASSALDHPGQRGATGVHPSEMHGRTLESNPEASPAAERDSARAVRVLVADGDAPRRHALRAALRDGGLSVVGQAADVSQAVYLAARLRPDVMLIDTTLPPTGGVAALRELAEAAPCAPVVLLASAGEDEAGLVALSEGAAGYLSREIERGSLARAVGRVARGEAAISRAMARRVIERLRGVSRGHLGLRPVRSPLTPREWEVLDLLAVGASTAEIARQLVVATDTVRSHVRHILRKLDVHSRREAIEVAAQLRHHPD
jgi:two-component system, NarL family, response regulator LiaR